VPSGRGHAGQSGHKIVHHFWPTDTATAMEPATSRQVQRSRQTGHLAILINFAVAHWQRIIGILIKKLYTLGGARSFETP
jgi:hypothetical protein